MTKLTLEDILDDISSHKCERTDKNNYTCETFHTGSGPKIKFLCKNCSKEFDIPLDASPKSDVLRLAMQTPEGREVLCETLP